MQGTLNTSEQKSKNYEDERQTVNLDSPGVAAQISKKLLYEVNSYAIKAYYEPHRWHLGASLIGHDCARYLWFTFRWCGREVGTGSNDEERTNNLGRKQRLFNRGHREEDRYIEYLRGIGATVWTHDESQPPQGGEYPQYRMSAINGHFGGSLDCIAMLPPRYLIEEPLLGEFKTNGTGANFTNLTSHGVAVEKTQHFIQMSMYGRHYKLRYGLYMNTNKNDDDMYIEIVKLNWNLADQMLAKAERIIYAFTPPPRLSESPTFYKCQGCAFKQVCHEGAPPETNCRSCVNASPVDGGEWFCSHYDAVIPRDFVPQGCQSYKALINA
ncbi:MAG TPA: hypothetical protein VHK27_07090 [Gammaproteobacteria bacterium]|nr:hypothetical protein [Gammaproteobacteria bacterium]